MKDTRRLDDQLVEEFSNEFLGYGRNDAPVWFVGMEEGGGGSLDELACRFSAWVKLGRRSLQDIFQYHKAVGHGIDQWFVGERPKLQSTWTGLIRLQFGMHGKDPAFMSEFDQRELVRDYQQNRLGRSNGDERLMELLPLPSPSSEQWRYASHSRLPRLANRQVYTEYQSPRRERRILREIRKYRPKLVVFYGLGYRDCWSRIAQEEFVPTRIRDAFVVHRDSTLFALVPHPVAHGLTRDYFFKVGKMLASA